MPAFVAIAVDSSDDHHDVEAHDTGTGTVRRLRVDNSLAGFEQLEGSIRETFGELPRRYALENPRLLLGRYLLHRGEAVYGVNPRSVVRMREALTASGKKGDPLDAHSLNVVLRERAEDLDPVIQSSPAGELLAGLSTQRTDLVVEKTRLLNQLTITLKSYYPRALELFPNLEQPLTLDFLTGFATAAELSAATEAQWQALFAGKRYPQPGRIERLWELAQTPQVPVSDVDAALGARRVRHLVRALRLVLEELAELESAIEAEFSPLPEADLFTSAPGSGPVLGPALFAIFGDNRERWGSWREVGQACGTVPITRSSGRSRSVEMRRHCDKRGRRTLHLFAGCSRRTCAWAGEFYADQRRRGKSHNTALRNLATKWLRILFRLWKDGGTYDEATYLRNRSARQQPRADAKDHHGGAAKCR
jgi:transposase